MSPNELLNSIDRDALRNQVRASKPVPNFLIDNFLKPDFAQRVAEAFPPYEQALAVGRSFQAVNEKGKVQVTESSRFPEPIRQLNEVLASPEVLDLMSYALSCLPTPRSWGAACIKRLPAATSTCTSTSIFSRSGSGIVGPTS